MRGNDRLAVSVLVDVFGLDALRLAARVSDETDTLLDAQACNLGPDFTVEGFQQSHPTPNKVLITLVCRGDLDWNTRTPEEANPKLFAGAAAEGGLSLAHAGN